MTTWYRVSNKENAGMTFSGDGGLYVAGRWNHIGKKVIYCSESIALCTLEWLSHNGLSVSGFNYHRFSIEVPDKLIRQISLSDLPKEWNFNPATDLTRQFAEAHLFSLSKTVMGLCVPSVLVPEEYNLIINPLHEKFIKIAQSIKYLGQYVAPER